MHLTLVYVKNKDKCCNKFAIEYLLYELNTAQNAD